MALADHRHDPRPLAALLLAVGLIATAAACGGGDDEGDAGAPAEGEVLDARTLEECLDKAGGRSGEPGADAVLAAYGQDAVDGGGDTFVIQQPVAQVLVFGDRVDLAEAEAELGAVTESSGLRAIGLQADAYGNVLVAYFNPQGSDKTAVNRCLGAKPEPVPGFETPYQGPEPAPSAVQ